ncbi:MAG: hypothetical protein U0Q07_16050 [Acidimicrobiales bacterium]
MGDNAKALIGLGIVVVLAAVAYLAAGDNGIIAAGLVLIVGLVGVFVLMKRGGSGGGSSDEYEYEDDDEQDAPASTATGTGGGLPTWSAEPLATWSPPEDGADDEPEPAYASFDDDDLDTSTFDELASFDDVDAVAEVDTYETVTDDGTDVEYEEVVEAEVEPEPVKTSLFSAPAPIREDLSSDEEILEASHATELHVPDGGENTELAKLLAKVQSRLAAYE